MPATNGFGLRRRTDTQTPRLAPSGAISNGRRGDIFIGRLQPMAKTDKVAYGKSAGPLNDPHRSRDRQGNGGDHDPGGYKPGWCRAPSTWSLIHGAVQPDRYQRAVERPIPFRIAVFLACYRSLLLQKMIPIPAIGLALKFLRGSSQ
jgi:hypothetical protein